MNVLDTTRDYSKLLAMTETAVTATDAPNLMTLLRRHRLAKGLTQTRLAKRVGVSVSAVSLWELGKTIPAPEMFPKLARIFGIDAM